MRTLDSKRARDLDDDHDDPRGTPGRSTLTSRLPPAASSIAHAVVRQLQAKGDLAGPDAHEVAAYGMAGAGNSLPFFDQIQRAFGHHDISGVRAHVGGRASEASSALGASAYASGDSVAFGSSPDLHLAAHEAAHVVQQRGGVRLSGGFGSVGDEYEVNADAVADRVVRGESAQDLLDPFSHRGSAGGAAVQRQEHAGSSAGVRDLDRMLLGHRSPSPAQIVACMRRHPDDARAILARVRERLGDAVALQVEVEVGLTAPELVPVLGSARAHGTSPVGTAAPSSGGLGPTAPPRASGGSPVAVHGEGDSITATAHPDAHSTVEATVGPGELSPELRDVRVVISDSTRGGDASGEIEVGADLESGRGRASVSGELHPDGEDGPTLSGEASVSAGAGDGGGVDVRGSGRLELRVPVGDHAALREALVITDDGHLRVEAGAELLRRVRGLPDGNAAREPLLRLFMNVDTDMRTGERSVSGGASLELRFDRDHDDGHEDPAELHGIARSGLGGGGASLPHLAQIQAAFGHHDVSGVRAHVGGAASAATGAMGARGYAYGDDVAFSASPDLHLAAHEAAHVVQQRGGVRLSGGVGRAGDEYERHADAVADLVVRGESAQGLLDERAHRGAAGGPAVQRDLQADREWLASLGRDASGHYTHMDGTPLTPAEQRRVRRIRRELGGEAARTPRSEMTAGVGAEERHEGDHVEVPMTRTGLDEERDRMVDETGTSHGHSSGGSDAASGGRTRRSARLADRARSRGRVEEIDERRSQEGTLEHPTSLGERVETHTHGTRSEALHGPTLEAGIHDRLVRAREAAERAERTARGAEALQAARDRLREIDRDIAAITAPGVSRATAMAIAERHDIRITMEEDVSTTTTTTDYNPLGDGSVGTSRRRDDSEVELDGSGRSSSDHRSTRVDVAGGAGERRTDTEETETAADGSSRTGRRSRTDRVAMGDGRLDASTRRRVEAARTDEDGEETRRARETERSAGAIIREDETGVRLGATDRTESEADGTSTAAERATAVEITDRRVGGSHIRRGEYEHGETRLSGHVSSDGSFSIDVTPLDDGSGQFRLTFTIHVGAGTEGTAAHGPESGDGRRGSATLRGSVGGDLITERVISEADAQRYLHAAEAADRGEEVSDPPEFGRLARLRAAGEGADALLQSGAVLGDGAAAVAMADGDSITLDTTAGIGGDASLHGERGGVGATIEAGGDAHWRRIVQVERITIAGHARVRVTVTYHDDTAWHAGASASVPEVAARFRHGEEEGATDSVQFVIDPEAGDYGERYNAIVRTTDRAELRALEARYAEDVRRSRHATTGAEETEYEGGPSSSAMVGLHTRTSRSDDVSTVMDADGNATGLEADISGGTDSDLRARVADHDVDLVGHSESAHGTLDRDHGASVDIEAHEEHIDPLAAIADGAHALSEADGRGRAALVLAHTPTEHLMNALQQFSHTWGYHLGEHDLEVMSERAGDSHNWSGCCIVADADVLGAWSSLRGGLANPRPDAAEARVDRPAAINIARMRALSTWMQNANGHGAECIERVLRRWGESRTHEVDAERLGAGYEWPVSLRDAHTRYDRLVTQADGMRDRFEAALAREHGDTEAQAHFQSVSTGFDSVLNQVRTNTDFTSEARRSEMISEIEAHRADTRARYADFTRRWNELHNDCGGEGPTADEIEATRASGAEITAARSREYVNAGIRTLRDNHARETEMLQHIQAIMRDVGDSPLFGNSERAEAAGICSQVHDLHRTWIQQIQDLRQAYTQAGTAESTWRVSTGPGTTRHRDLEPNVGWLIIEYSRVMRNNAFDAYWEGRVEEWRQEGNEY